MGGVTVAPQMTENDPNSFLSTFNADATPIDNTSGDLNTNALPLPSSTHGWPMEDLTGEVHDLMLRESLSWLPWMDQNQTKAQSPLIKTMTDGLDSQLLTQTLQLDGLFDQTFDFEQLDEMASSLFYDEMIYDHSPVNTPLPTPTEDISQLRHHTFMDVPVLTEQSYQDQNDKVITEPIKLIPNQVDNNGDDDMEDSTDDDSDSDDSGSDSEDEDDGSVMTSTYMYLPKRQVEETLLEKITHHLESDKLPGILSIVSSGDEKEDGEVEIDLSCLAREQLVRVMLYVDACIAEQQGGPKVKLTKYLVKESKKNTMNVMSEEDDDDDDDMATTTTTTTTGRRRKSNDTKNEGPISMAALTKKSRSRKPSLDTNLKNSVPNPKRRRTRKKQQEGQNPTRPKRRAAALHKRRMLEEMLLVPSEDDEDITIGDDNDIDDDNLLDQQVMITYGEEQMDFGVVDNQTIVHQPLPTLMDQISVDDLSIAPPINNEEDDEDEEIDIM